MANDARPSARRILASVAIIGFVVGGAAAAWRAVDDSDRGSTYAALFSSPAIDLRLDGPHGVDGFLGGENLAPGDRVAGLLSLSTNEPLDSGLADLDVGLELELTGDPGVHRLDEDLVLTRLTYGIDDLLSAQDGGRSVGRSLDADGDGDVSLRELAAGIDDLPVPRTAGAGGTGLSIEVAFRPAAGATNAAYEGQRLHVRFVFQLSDAMGPDL